MKIKNCVDPQVWEDFIAKNQPWNFLQSYWWSEVIRGENKEIKCWEIWSKSEKKLYGVVLLEKKKIARGGFYYLESLWGPVWSRKINTSMTLRLLRLLYEHIKEKENCVFWRLSPPASVLISPRYLESEYYLESGFEEATSLWDFFPTLARTRPPKSTSVIDLMQDPDDILAQMKPKTRYNIKLAQRKNLKIVWSRSVGDLRKFWKLNLITANRSGFTPHQFSHYLNILKANSSMPSNRAEIVLASNKGKTISANLALFFNNTVYYLHGASSDKDRNLMSPFLLHWDTINKAKNEGFEFYDFWGIDKKKWPGITRFKKGFGGKRKDYPLIYEIPLKGVYYNLYRLFRRIKG